MQKYLGLLFLISLELLVASCSSTTVKPGAEKVRIFEAEPKGCLYQAEVFSLQVDEIPEQAIAEMSIDTRNDLRNKAHDNNGNVLVFAVDKNKKATTTAAAGAKKDAKVDLGPITRKETVFIGHVFRCPASVVNQ